MLGFYATQIEILAVHRIGNKSRNEALFLSHTNHPLNEELTAILKAYFFKPFREKEENFYRFTDDLEKPESPLKNYVAEIFSDPSPSLVHQNSKKIAQLLFDQSLHPHIKSGELYVCYFDAVDLDNEKVDVIGIFKSEIKQDFLQFAEQQTNLELVLQQGINLNKLDKGCLIFNCNESDDYRILSVDSNRYDTRYWLDDFLGVSPLVDDRFLTKKYMKFCQDFAKEVVLPAEDKKEEVMFLNRAVNHFAKNDTFEESNFLNEVIDNPDLIPEFNQYKIEKAPKYQIEDLTTFPIANQAVTAARKKIKNTIHLDTQVQIKMDFVNPDSAEKYVEKGWDEERQMYYYLVYFNKEQKT